MDLSFGAVKESCRRVKGRINSPKSIHLRQKIDSGGFCHWVLLCYTLSGIDDDFKILYAPIRYL